MSTEEPDIRIDDEDIVTGDNDTGNNVEDIGTGEQPAEGGSFGVTAYIDVTSDEEQKGKTTDLYTDTLLAGLFADDVESAAKATRVTGLTDQAGRKTRVTDLDEEATELMDAVSDADDAGDEEEGTEAAGKKTLVVEGKLGDAEAESEEGGTVSETEDGSEEEPAEGEEENEAEPDPEIEAIKQKIRERKREKRRKARMRRVRFWTILSLLLISAAALIFSLSSFFTVDSIEVKGNSHFSAEEIINIAHAVPGHNILYDPGSAEIIEYLEQNPYIKSATVSRKLPSTLVITVNERKQACAFKYDDDYLVMDDEGILLKKTRTQPKITMINGLVASKIKLGETIGTKDQQMFSRTLKLIREMNAGDLYFVSIDMSEYGESRLVRAYVYDKLVVKADYDLLLGNISNGRLHKVLESLFADGVQRGTITLNADGSAGFEPGL